MKQSGLAKELQPGPNLILKAVASVIVSLGIWWFLLKGISIWFLQRLAYVPLLLLIGASSGPPLELNPQTGGWDFHVRMNYDTTNPQTGKPIHIDSIDFTADPKLADAFTGALFTYAGLALAVGVYSKTQWQRILRGFGLQLALSVLAIALFAYTKALAIVVNGHTGSTAVLSAVSLCEYLITLVVPYASPFAVVVMVLPQWKNYFAFHVARTNKLHR